jgi:hypothetical protein
VRLARDDVRAGGARVTVALEDSVNLAQQNLEEGDGKVGAWKC